MKYTVVWTATAEEALAAYWVAADNRQEMADAARSIDLALQFNPNDVGESREFDQRVLYVPPPGTLYAIRPDDALVRVLRTWLIRRRKS